MSTGRAGRAPAAADVRRGSAGEPPLRAGRVWWALGWAMVLFMLYATLSPVKYVPDPRLNDKVEHAVAFFGLTFWFGGLVRRGRYPWLVLCMELLGAGIELAQGAMGLGRDMDFRDWVADTVGVGVALLLLVAAVPRTAGSWIRMLERRVGL